MRCPVCRERPLEVFFESLRVPVHANVLCADRPSALAVPRGDIRLGFCGGCGTIHNVSFDPERMEYGPEYDNTLHHSPEFQAYAAALVERLVRKYDLREKVVLEIGCGKGEFLEMLCRAGKNRGIGFDPSYDGELHKTDGTGLDLRFVRKLYGSSPAHPAADLIVCRHALEHVQDPVAFLESVRKAVGEKDDAVLYFEVPDVRWTLESLGVWDVIYEHCSYFSDLSMERAFEEAGFRMVCATRSFGGQFLSTEAAPETAALPSFGGETVSLENLARRVRDFSKNYQRKVSGWEEFFESLPPGEKVVIWGTGSKGVSFLNTVAAASRRISYAVDINPAKQGKFVPGSGQEIVGPDRLKDYHPDLVLVMNPNYRDEVAGMLRASGVDAAVAVEERA